MQWSEFRAHVRHLSSEDLDRVKTAFGRGEEAHSGQKRKSGEPYFTHCIAVANSLADMGADADTIIAALLHDAIEDTPLTLEMIEQEFDSSVPSLIDGVTKLDETELKENPTFEQETETLRKIFTYMQQDVRIMIIKLADRLHNMQTLKFLDPKRQQSLAEETRDVYVKIADRLSMRDFRDELEALCISILEPDLFGQLTELRRKNKKTNDMNIHKIITALHESHLSLIQNISIKCEPKSWGRLHAQLEAKGSSVTGVSALTAVFICKDTETCYRVFGALHQCYQRETLSFEDYINSPQINGYQGLHTTIILEDGTRVRCKIRTEEMDEYAYRGITTKCFDSEAMGILDYLPWTNRIATLSADTADRSEQFWASLQSDILGDSIVIHGPNDKTFTLPKGSTALDGALYLYAEKALAVTSIKVNGKEVTFSTPLEHAASLDLTLANKPVVKREWLEWVQTGFATATIRTALGQQSDRRKINIGQYLLCEALKDHKAGFIEEFKQEGFKEGLQSLGYSSLREAYISIADGHLEPEEIYTAIFAPRKTKNLLQKKLCTVRYSVPVDNPDIHAQLAKVHQEFHAFFKQVYYSEQHPKHLAFTKVKVHLSPDEQKAYINKLIIVGAKEVEIFSVSSLLKLKIGIGIIILLWGINPVIAKWFLSQGITPLSIVTIRMFAFFLYATVFFVGWKFFFGKVYKPIPHAMKRALLPAIGLFALPIFTYYALTMIPPSVHLTILRFNVLLLPLFTLTAQRTIKSRSFLFTMFVCLAGLGLLLLMPTNLPAIGILLSVLALFTYSSYSLITEHTLQRHKIGDRYPQLLLNIGVLLGIFGVILAMFQPLNHIWNSSTLPIALYVLICVFIPHTCFNAILKKLQFKYITDMFLVEIPIAIVAEVLLLSIVLSPTLYLIITGILAAILLVRWKSLMRYLP